MIRTKTSGEMRIYQKVTSIFNVLKAIFVSLVFMTQLSVSGQTIEIDLAKEYFLNEEYEKSIELYSKISKKEEHIPTIYNEYRKALIILKNSKELTTFMKRVVKQFPKNMRYRIDYFVFLEDHDKKEAEKEFKIIENYVKINPAEVENIGNYLVEVNRPGKALDIYLIGRKTHQDKYLYVSEISSLYRSLNKKDLMINELLSYLQAKPQSLELIQNTFQNLLDPKTEFDQLENVLYTKIQKEPEEIAYNELLLWLNLQKKEFGKAFIQAKAIDKRLKSEGLKLLQVGKIAFENKDYENALKYFQSIVDTYKNSVYYPEARKLLINTKEEIVKNTFPVDFKRINSLISDYRILIRDIGKSPATLDAMRSKALLHAFYLNEKDSALALLSEAVLLAKSNLVFQSKVKLDMGDIYLLNSEPWEATLLYSQVEKAQKDEVLGHEAKLKNAKLSYYKGEFELAQEHLDVLKLATSREIANDAMELSILIQDNIVFDTSTEALSDYSKIDLLLFQNKVDDALKALEKMEVKYQGHTLADDILFQKAKVYRTLGDYENAVKTLDKMNENFSADILGDDALYLLGNIFEENLKDITKAKEVYEKFLFQYPGSIFTVEARKKYRILRGDKLN